MSHILIVDDEPDILDLLSITVRRLKLSPITAGSVAEAKAMLAEHPCQLCLTDMRLPDGTGMELIQYVQEHHADVPTVMITAYGSIDVAIEAMKHGAFDFLSKPVDLEKLRAIIQSATKLEHGTNQLVDSDPAPNILGQSKAIRRLKSQIDKVARSHAPVFINGESGSGKELVARAIHQLSPRRDGPFIAVNCGAIPSELMESEFFGHKKGAFTGAHSQKEGFFQAAHGGTLFLDEVADLPLVMQVKLLRAIQENSIRPVGSENEISVDVRILSASHKNLQNEVQKKNFREDLFYRLDVINLAVPALRERQDDILLLADHILSKLGETFQSGPKSLSEAAKEALSGYAFPGNVRELENILQRAVTLAEGEAIECLDLNLKSLPLGSEIPTNELSSPASTATTTSAPPSGSYSLQPGQALETFLEEVEKDILQKTLEECRWNKTAAAEKLGMSFRSIRYRLKKLGIE